MGNSNTPYIWKNSATQFIKFFDNMQAVVKYNFVALYYVDTGLFFIYWQIQKERKSTLQEPNNEKCTFCDRLKRNFLRQNYQHVNTWMKGT